MHQVIALLNGEHRQKVFPLPSVKEINSYCSGKRRKVGFGQLNLKEIFKVLGYLWFFPLLTQHIHFFPSFNFQFQITLLPDSLSCLPSSTSPPIISLFSDGISRWVFSKMLLAYFTIYNCSKTLLHLWFLSLYCLPWVLPHSRTAPSQLVLSVYIAHTHTHSDTHSHTFFFFFAVYNQRTLGL